MLLERGCCLDEPAGYWGKSRGDGLASGGENTDEPVVSG
jgi:hypothetical protein